MLHVNVCWHQAVLFSELFSFFFSHLVSQSEASDIISKDGLSVVGWYHSHPTFIPNPSLQDLSTQAEMQRWFSDTKAAPFVGLILSPYCSNTTSFASVFRYVLSFVHFVSHKIAFRQFWMVFFFFYCQGIDSWSWGWIWRYTVPLPCEYCCGRFRRGRATGTCGWHHCLHAQTFSWWSIVLLQSWCSCFKLLSKGGVFTVVFQYIKLTLVFIYVF